MLNKYEIYNYVSIHSHDTETALCVHYYFHYYYIFRHVQLSNQWIIRSKISTLNKFIKEI